MRVFRTEEIDRQFAISQAFFNLPIEEKKSNTVDVKNGGYLGYRAVSSILCFARQRTSSNKISSQPYERTIADTDVLDNMELVSIPKYADDYKDYPRHDIFKAHDAVIAEFHRKCWHQIAKPLFVLFALAMELPESYFVERHEYGKSSQDHLRYVSCFISVCPNSTDYPL